MREYPELRQVLAMEALPILESLLSNTDEFGYIEDNEIDMDINSLIIGLGNGSVVADSSVNEPKVKTTLGKKKGGSITDVLGADLNTTVEENID